jgi:Holliday junction DNA helicase RuvB
VIQDIRPRTFDEVVGQQEVVEYLQLKVESCQKTGYPPGHILFMGGEGTGKSTLATVFSGALNQKMKSVSASRMDSWRKIFGVLTELEEGNVFFIDEIHALRPKVQESLYDAMEDYKVDIFEGPPRNTHPVTIKIPRFTLIGATTHAGSLNSPLLRRFDYKPMLSPYTIAELHQMVHQACIRIYERECPDDVAVMIAKLSKRNASAAYSLLKNYQEMEVVMSEAVPIDILTKTIKLEKIDPWIGLDYTSRKYLNALILKYPIGLDRMSSTISEQIETIRWLIEPFLMSNIRLDNYYGPMVEIDRSGRKPTEVAEYYIWLCQQAQKTEGWFSNEIFG